MLSALKKCFEEASKLKAGSVALPSMGLGAKGFPSKDVAAATLQAITEFTESNPTSSVTQVKLYLYKPALSANQLKVCLNILIKFIVFWGTIQILKTYNLSRIKWKIHLIVYCISLSVSIYMLFGIQPSIHTKIVLR